MIRVVCVCGRVFKAEDRHAGRQTRCPSCGAGLVIGQGPDAAAGAGDPNDAPSWWYPVDPADATAAKAMPAAGRRDSESMPTAIIEPAAAPRPAEHNPPPERGGASGPRGLASSRLWTVAGAVAVTVLLACGAFYRLHTTLAGRGDGGRSRAPAGARPPARRGGDGRALLDRAPAGTPDDGSPARPARRLRLIVPAYIYPDEAGRKQWSRLIDAAGKVGLIAVVNPDSGPGSNANPQYSSIITAAARRGVTLVGYVNTTYGKRPAAQVKDDIDAWVTHYPRIGGFFLDQQPVDARDAAYFGDLAAYARGRIRAGVVVGNPGVPCHESYLSGRAADVVCVFAKPDGFESFELPATLRDYDASRIAALIYQVPDAEVMRRLLREAIIKRIGCIYITDATSPNPWGRLPSYWDAEVETIARLQ